MQQMGSILGIFTLNFKLVGIRGQAYKYALWNATRVATIREGEVKTKEIIKMDNDVYE